MTEADAASRREAESLERQGDELAADGALDQAEACYRNSQKILLPTNKMWTDAEEYDLRMSAFQRVQRKLWALAAGAPDRARAEAHLKRREPEGASPSRPPPKFGPSEAARRFEASMVIGYDQWHDGIGYDLEALREMTDDERKSVEALLTGRAHGRKVEWRDIEALAALDSAPARQTLRALLKSSVPETRLRAARELHAMGEALALDKFIADVLRQGEHNMGVTLALGMTPDHATPYLRKVLLDCAREGDRAIRVHAAAMCLFLAGQASSPFDWSQRPFFLQFGEADEAVRAAAFAELKRRLAAGAKRSAKRN